LVPTILNLIPNITNLDQTTPVNILSSDPVVINSDLKQIVINSDLKQVVVSPNKKYIISENKKINNEDVTSLDDEVNSYGKRDDRGFDILSGDSTTETIISTPYVEKNGNYYCKDSSHTSHVIDVCSYSDATIFLLNNGNIICERENNKKKMTNNIILIRITSFNGYLYALGKDKLLYILPNDLFFSDIWIWNPIDWTPSEIIHISSTYNSEFLWIQTLDTGYLYDDIDHLILECNNYKLKRVYGRNNETYIEIDNDKHTATIYPGKKIVENIYDATLSYYDDLMPIKMNERNTYRGVTIVNWNPYFIPA